MLEAMRPMETARRREIANPARAGSPRRLHSTLICAAAGRADARAARRTRRPALSCRDGHRHWTRRQLHRARWFLPAIDFGGRSYGGMLQAANIIDTESGQPLAIPTDNYTETSARSCTKIHKFAEEEPLVFGSVALGAFTYTRQTWFASARGNSRLGIRPVGASQECFGNQIGRITNLHLTAGDGISKPIGTLTDGAWASPRRAQPAHRRRADRPGAFGRSC